MINVEKILSLQMTNIVNWHNELELKEEEMPWKAIEENNQWNFLLWHEEDIARIKDIDSMRIVEAKRNIDRYNQARNNAMEKIDEWVLSYLQLHTKVVSDKLHTETPGMMIDRLSIMALKRFHMYEQVLRTDADSKHIENCNAKVAVLDEQIKDLSNSLKNIFTQLTNGELQFKVYRQFKMYNDPSLNPELYTRGQNSL
jgi:predicted  nucleic acid-binding Zn-ribbon protein